MRITIVAAEQRELMISTVAQQPAVVNIVARTVRPSGHGPAVTAQPGRGLMAMADRIGPLGHWP